ncbi:unnamed protein product [Danaus chrysippus]|uniref:(African queen) hypothetical protein n=1 Tax=Danaus chrysippus TaxID=151541 RepID=A0A8J2RCM6_9NEOP|nr:unnamed protein product [Danaus chrysippus]
MRTENNTMLTNVHETKCSIGEEEIDKLMDSSVQESLQQIIAKEGYESYEISIKKLSTDGGNYLGDLYEVDVKGTTVKGLKEINLFVKQAIKMNPTESVVNVNSIYQNELFVYNELSKVYSNLQDEAIIPSGERFKVVNSYNESNEDAIILENLSKKGFEVRNRMDVGSESAEAILIDYQLIFWGSPVFDLLYFFYMCTDRAFRKKHMTYLKNIYHGTLRNYLNFFKMDVDKIYPKKLFLEDFENHLEVGLLVAFYGLPFCFTREDAVPDFKDNVTDMKIKLHDSFFERFEGIVDDYLEWGII